VLLVSGAKVVRAIHTSTGIGGDSPGWALHGYADVPNRPASHGCARLPLPEAKLVYDFVSIGTPVRVI
jgi:lipoprotein-anchoring transpeptidase ErfK/SrfK